jgi:hypothetical protein
LKLIFMMSTAPGFLQLHVKSAFPETKPLAPCAVAMIFAATAVGERHVARPFGSMDVLALSEVLQVAVFKACVWLMLHGGAYCPPQ